MITDDVFAVAVPTSMKAVGFFRPAGERAIAPGERDDVARRLATNSGGWNVVAVGIRGHVGLSLKVTGESEAVTQALTECAARDQECRVIAIGMFSVEAKAAVR